MLQLDFLTMCPDISVDETLPPCSRTLIRGGSLGMSPCGSWDLTMFPNAAVDETLACC